MIITGKYDKTTNLDKITKFVVNNSINTKGNLLSNHVWVDNINDKNMYNIVNEVRNSNDIINVLKNKFPDYNVKNVNESDEIYFGVSPKDASGSDRSLVDCHYDAPFSILPNFNVLFYRIILACNKNEHVTTTFPNDNIAVKMDIGDFHGLDYNKDYHCAEGEIPSNKNRVLLKLHYILVPKNMKSNYAENYVRFINTKWTTLSREFMRMSSNPNNILEYGMGSMVNISRFIFNNLYLIIFIIICMFCLIFLYNKTYNNVAITSLQHHQMSEI